MTQDNNQKEVVVVETLDLPMSWYVDTMWVDFTIKAMYISDIFPIIGIPFYILFALIVYFQYQYMNLWSLWFVFDNFDGPVEGKEDFTIGNWFLFPIRRSIIFNMLFFVGLVGNLMIPINFIIVPVTGLLAWINNYY